MKKVLVLLGLFVFVFSSPAARGQSDSDATLHWVEKQAERIDTLLENAVLSHEHVDLIFKMTDAFLLFDAVGLAGVYCPEIREAAQAGRNYTDVVNYRLEKDLNSSVVRATYALIQAEKMRVAAQKCRSAAPEAPAPAFSPVDVLREEAHIAELILSDGLAVDDFHLLSQKLEQAIRVLHDVEHLASTFQRCSGPAESAAQAILYCEAALAAHNWTELKAAVNRAWDEVKTVAQAPCN